MKPQYNRNMKKHLYIILFLLTLHTVGRADNAINVVMGTVKLNGETISAEYSFNEAGGLVLGSGRNACIPQYSVGEVEVPAEISVNGQLLPVVGVADVAFRLCTHITSVSLPEGVTRVGNFAFKGCQDLTQVTLPSTMESIGTGAFIALPSLSDLFVKATVPPVWEYNDVFCFHEGGIGDQVAFSIGSIHLYVPEDNIPDYEAALYTDADLGWTFPDGWGRFSDIRSIEPEVVLIDNGTDNEEILSGVLDKTTSVQLKGRTIRMSGEWNTLCLPFDVTPSVLQENLQEGFELMALNGVSLSNGSLTLDFTTPESLEAGTPFLIRWTEAQTENVVNPVFKNVTITTTHPGYVHKWIDEPTIGLSFQGVFNRYDIEEENRSILYLGGGSTLYYPQQAMSINAFRAYFVLEGLQAGDPASGGEGINSFQMRFDGEESGITAKKDYSSETSGIWYTLQGIRLASRPVEKGIYLHKGHKQVVK